jgi:hypothetical protein
MKVIWTAKARITYYEVLDYLNKNWTQKEIVQFFQKTENIINVIKNDPGIFAASVQGIRKAVIDRNNLLIYRTDDYNQKLYLLTFFNSRQNPDKLKE